MKLLLSLLILLTAANISLAAKPNKKDRQTDPSARILKKLDAAGLAAEPAAKAKKTIEEHAAKLKEAQAKVDAVLTTEQKQAQLTARKEARQAGKKSKEARAAVAAALKLTDEQKKQLATAQSALQAENAALAKDLKAALPAEDFAKLGLRVRKKKA